MDVALPKADETAFVYGVNADFSSTVDAFPATTNLGLHLELVGSRTVGGPLEFSLGQ